MDSIISYLLESAPWVAVVLVAIFATWKVSKYHEKLEAANKKVNNLPCERHSDHLTT